VLEVLAAFIREQRSRAMATERARHGDARADNAPRCTGCGRRNWAPNPQARPGVSLARANFAAANLTGAPWRSDAGVPQGWQQTPTRAAGSRPILARAVRQQTCYASTGLPYLLSGICTGASSRHGMAGQQARLPRPKRCPSARAVVSTRPPGSPAPGGTPPGAPGPACARPAPGRTRTASMTRSPAPGPHSWPFAHSGG